MIKLLIVESHPILLHGFITELKTEQGIKIVGTATEIKEAIKKADELKPDVILLDMTMHNKEGFNAIHSLKKNHSDVKILIEMISTHLDAQQKALQLGADAFLPISCSGPEIGDIIRNMNKGKTGAISR